MLDFLLNFLNGPKKDENYLKEFSREFFRRIVDINDYSTLESSLGEWIKNVGNNTELMQLMQIHEKSEIWFSSIIGYFYQYGIGCDVDENKALELYLLAINTESLNQDLQLMEVDDDESDMLQNINIIIGKYLLSLFYYKDIILESKLNDLIIKYLKSSRKGDPIAQYNLGICYEKGLGTEQDCDRAFEWYFKSANNGCGESQNYLGYCYQHEAKDYIKAFEWYFRSANNGCAKGQNNLGNCYQHGQGVPQDYNQA